MKQTYQFYTNFARILNSGQSRSVIISGNIDDLFWNGNEYVPLLTFLVDKTKPSKQIQLVYELNGPIRVSEEDRHKLRDAWVKWKVRMSTKNLSVRTVRQQVLKDSGADLQIDKLAATFDNQIRDSIGNATLALEFLRQLCFCSRDVMDETILIFIEAADMLVPPGKGDLSSLNDKILRRIAILQDWFSDPEFVNGKDSVCLLAESPSMLHPRVAKLPQVVNIEVPAPSMEERRNYLDHFFYQNPIPEDSWSRTDACARFTAGLSIYALRQLLVGATYSDTPLTVDDVTERVEIFIKSQVGEDVVEFKKPHHRLKDVIGASSLKKFLQEELIPRFNAKDHAALTGAAVSGPIGGGKTFIFEAVAAELDMPILILKNLRSQWFGQTDVIFERLKRTLEALDKVLIFIDEADTQFGRVDSSAHSTEKRLTGKIQQMMSDP
ncbi:MAG: ATP-binding protein, partial [Lentisphaeraceae bacterium]|nr:ATP-binding protein [Lentisphaeraceae bacterium]